MQLCIAWSDANIAFDGAVAVWLWGGDGSADAGGRCYGDKRYNWSAQKSRDVPHRPTPQLSSSSVVPRGAIIAYTHQFTPNARVQQLRTRTVWLHDSCVTHSHGRAGANRVSKRQVDAVMEASRALVAIAASSVAEVDDQVTLPQLRVLVMIATQGPRNVATVADALAVNPSNASRTCERLVRAGLLDRRESVADRRNMTLSLTNRGRKVVATVIDRRRTAIEQVLATMAAADRRSLADAFGRFAAAAGEPAEHDVLSALWAGDRKVVGELG